MTTYKLLLLPGDGIGPEVMAEVEKVVGWLKRAGLADFETERDLVGGVYFGEPKEITTLDDGSKRAVDTQVYTTAEIERIAHVAFDLARKRSGRVASAEKNNVMKTGVLWKEVVTRVHAEHYSEV